MGTGEAESLCPQSLPGLPSHALFVPLLWFTWHIENTFWATHQRLDIILEFPVAMECVDHLRFFFFFSLHVSILAHSDLFFKILIFPCLYSLAHFFFPIPL